jgi:hypothetical protein
MHKIKKIWILTLVKRGFIQEPEVFFEENKAQNRRKALISDFNPDYDEIAIFEKELASDNTPL